MEYVPGPVFMGMVLGVAESQLGDFNPQALSCTAGALAKLKCVPWEGERANSYVCIRRSLVEVLVLKQVWGGVSQMAVGNLRAT
jgi:hypothetical protein